MNALRAQAQQQLRVYLSRTGFSLREVGELTGYSHHSLIQFCSAARYGDGPGEETAEKILSFIAANPAPLPELPGKLYETEGTREMDRLLAFCRRGRWGILYGPAGAQKSFLLEYRAAAAAREEARRIATGELGELREQAVARLLDKCAATDPLSKRQYVNARRLFNTLREIREARGERKPH